MPIYYITSEMTEDTYGSTTDLTEARQIAQAIASQSPVGELITIEANGRGVAQFVRTDLGSIKESRVAEAA